MVRQRLSAPSNSGADRTHLVFQLIQCQNNDAELWKIRRFGDRSDLAHNDDGILLLIYEGILTPTQDKLLRHAAHDYIVYGMIKGTSFFSVFLGFLFGVWVVTLWILSSLPGQDIYLPPFPEADKVAHFGYFFIGGFLLAWVLRRTRGWRGWKLLCGALCAIALIGALDELHQLYTPDRSGGDPADWTADCAGGALGALVIGWIYVRGRDRRPQAPSGAVAQGD